MFYCAFGKDAKGPHPHNGMVKPYQPGPPSFTLTKRQLSDLEEGKLVEDMLKGKNSEDGGKAGRALAVQDVDAPPEYVWDRIKDFNNYKNMVPKVVECYNYDTETLRNVSR
ncbi:unnamed protein product [Choristocarpus tenellus]